MEPDNDMKFGELLSETMKLNQKPILKKDVANYFKVDNFDIVEVGDEDVLFVQYNGKSMPLTLFYTLVCVHGGNITAEIFNKNAI